MICKCGLYSSDDMNDKYHSITVCRINKPWGYEIIWAKTDHYVGKILHIRSGQKLSRQYHAIKEETLMVQNGMMQLEIGPKEKNKIQHMAHGDVFHIIPGVVHRMIAITDVDVIEVSTPELNDVIRLEDDYGRI